MDSAPPQPPPTDMSTFIELSPDNLTQQRVPEKGILKHGRPEDNWDEDDDEQDNNDSSSDVERTLKNINGYHEEILEALHSASQRLGDNSSLSKRSPSQDSHKSASEVNYSSLGGKDHQQDNEAMDEPMPVPIRIRNLEDLLRQLEHHPLQSSQHMSPACSDEIRLSEPEADRHCLLGRQDRSGSEGRVDPGLQYLLDRLQGKKGGPYEEDDDDEDQSGDDEGSTYSSHQLVRSASEEALPVSSRRDYSYGGRKSKGGGRRMPEPCDYAPSPPPSEDSYANSSEDNAFLPAVPPAPPSARGARTAKVEPEPMGPPAANSTGSLPSGAKRKGKKKFPEYKVN